MDDVKQTANTSSLLRECDADDSAVAGCNPCEISYTNPTSRELVCPRVMLDSKFDTSYFPARCSQWCYYCYMNLSRPTSITRTPLCFDTAQVLVLMLRESQREAVVTLIESEVRNEGLDNVFIVYFSAPNKEDEVEEVNGGDLPTKALLNAVGDLCQTRYQIPYRGPIPRFTLMGCYSLRCWFCVVSTYVGCCATPSIPLRAVFRQAQDASNATTLSSWQAGRYHSIPPV